MQLINNRAIRLFAWVQMLASIALAGGVLYGYATYGAPIKQAFESFRASILSVSKVIDITAETLASREELINSTKQTLLQTRAAIEQIRRVISAQTSQAPQRAEELRAASRAIARFGELLDTWGDRLINISVPSRIEFEGLKPMVVLRRPMEPDGANFKANAKDFRTVSDGILQLSKTVEADGVQLGAAFWQLSEQTMKLLEESEKSLRGIQQQALPMAVQEMRRIASQMQSVSNELANVSSVDTTAPLIGLVFSALCFLNGACLLALASRSAGEHKP